MFLKFEGDLIGSVATEIMKKCYIRTLFNNKWLISTLFNEQMLYYYAI